MSLAAGTRVGPYEIRGALGAGGMGEVYLARDSKLGRDVALKTLPPAFAADPERRARFEREARTLASLNHPNIAAIYGVEETPAGPALVMELVSGRTLAAVMAGPAGTRHAVAIGDTLSIARQIADALEAAHEHGIVHRDLKPGNVMVRDDGTVKVLDFGLAKTAVGGAAEAYDSPAVASAPTMTSPAVTSMGTILGTAAYMSPEQARGRAVDKRADIWAFGVVLWEMLTGRRLFSGETVTETIASVIKDDTHLDALPRETPDTVRRLITRCLERDPKLRLRDIGEARITLSQPLEAPSASLRPAASHRGAALTAAAGVILAAVVGVAVWQIRPAPGTAPLRRFELSASVAGDGTAELSPDGTRIAYFKNGRVYVRALDSLAEADLGAVPPASATLFWSPDGRTIGFSGQASIRTIPAAGGPTFVVCKVPASGRVMDAEWLADGTIAFSVWRESLYTVPAAGGAPVVFRAIDPATEIDFHAIASMPDGRLIVFTHKRAEASNLIELTNGRQHVTLTDDQSIDWFQYAPPGVFLFSRIATNVGVWVVPFTEGPVDFTKATLVQAGGDRVSTASDGSLLVRVPAPKKSSLVWVGRTGETTPVPGAPVETEFTAMALSPDGRHASFIMGGETNSSLVVRDLGTGIDTPLTRSDPAFSSTQPLVNSPAWFPTGDRVLYFRGHAATSQIFARKADGSGDAQLLTTGNQARISADGRTFLFTIDDRGSGRLRVAPIQPDGTLGRAEPVFAGENEPKVPFFDLSPNGLLLATTERQPDNKLMVFLSDMPGAKNRRLLVDGGTQPRFSRDSREVFYMQGTRTASGPAGRLMSLTLAAGPAAQMGRPAEIVDGSQSGAPTISGYDVAPDAKRFLMWKAVPAAPGEDTRLILVQNWSIHR